MRSKQNTVCHTCRAHKLGCDGKRPSCSQCQFIGRSCGGYRLDLVVVPHKAAPRKRNSRKIVSKRCLPSSSAAQTSTAADEIIIDSGLTQLLSRDARQCPIPRPIDSTTPEQFTTAILSYFMPENKRGCFYLDSSSIQVCGAWVDILPRLVDVARPGSLISSATRAFGAAILDRSSDGRYSSFKPFEAYNSTIQQLKSALSAPKSSFSIETAAAIACLFMAELMLPTSSVGPHAHLAGFSALIRSYPPDRFSLEPFRAIFAGCRPIILIQALQTRKHTFLAQEEWKTVPFCHHPPLDMQKLMSDAAILPSLLEEADFLHTALPSHSVVSRAQMLRGELVQIMERLSNWKEIYGMYATTCPRVSRKKQGPDCLEDAGVCLTFPDMLTGTMHIYIWTFEAISLEELVNVDSLLCNLRHVEKAEEHLVREAEHIAGITELAVMISRSIDYFLQDDMKLYGPASALFPLRTAFFMLSRDQRGNREDIERCHKLIARIRRKGLSTIPHFPEICMNNGDSSNRSV